MNIKLAKLKKILKRMGSVLIAYSGGVDSTFLLKISTDILKDKVLAITALSPTYPQEELIFSQKMTKQFGVKHKIIKTKEFKDKKFIANPINRCYFCKRGLFRNLKEIAKKHKLNFVIDASNVSDKDDFRPGDKAKNELKVRSPLQEAGFSKGDIRRASKKLGLITWNKPSLACLASRIPYGIKISSSILERIYRAEKFLRQLGFKVARLRHYHNFCRIEVCSNDIYLVIKRRDLIIKKLKSLGYDYITVDLEGYRMGSMNSVIPKKLLCKKRS